MKLAITTLILISVADPAIAAASGEGIVTSVDGKGGFQVAIHNRGRIDFQASSDIMGDMPAFKLPDWPHVYKNLQKGDHIKIRWGKDEKTGKTIADGLRIIKRGG